MKTTAIIAEYNPFHKGHEYHIKQTRHSTQADYVIAIMSGDFVQRGAPSIFNKYQRTQMALLGGVDVVIELPALYALSSAEYFAGGGITLLNQLGVIDYLSFGSEAGDIKPLMNCAQALLDENSKFNNEVLHQLRQGTPFPAARQNALLTSGDKPDDQEWISLLSAPNNILALEYCKSLIATKSSIKPDTILRMDSSYHDDSLSDATNPYSSATAIRNAIYDSASRYMPLETSQEMPDYMQHIPSAVHTVFGNEAPCLSAIHPNDFSALLHYKLLTRVQQGFSSYLDCSKDISNKITNQLRHFSDFEGFCQLIKSKDVTYTRISRVLMHILLDITTPAFYLDPIKERALFTPYARLLGFKKEAAPLLSFMNKHSSIPLITKMADARNLLSPQAYAMLEQDIFCANVYEAVCLQEYGRLPINEFQSSPVIV